jgi:hypothetical protein
VRERLAVGLLIALQVCGAGCATDVVSPESTARPVLVSLRVPTDAEDAAIFQAVVRSITRDLKLSLPHVSVEAVDRTTFVQTLVAGGIRPELAEAGMGATVIFGRVLVRSDALSHMSVAARAEVYAHELAHIAQAQLRGNECKAWILEGHADWVAYQIGDRLGHRSYAQSREVVRRRVLGSTMSRARFPPLNDLETGEAWLRASVSVGWAPTYGQAFLAVDRLAERYTEDRLREFFRRFGGPDGRLRRVDAGGLFGDHLEQRYWNAVFPVTYRDFVAEFRAHLETLR